MTTDTIMLQKTILATIRADRGFRTTKDPQTLSEELAGLISELKKGVCLFSYRKKDGEIRKATGTLSRDIMDRYLDGVGGTPKGHRKSARPLPRRTSTSRRGNSDASSGRTSSGRRMTIAFRRKVYSLSAHEHRSLLPVHPCSLSRR